MGNGPAALLNSAGKNGQCGQAKVVLSAFWPNLHPEEMMHIHVKLFAALGRHIVGGMTGTPLSLEVPDETTIADLVRQLNLPREEVKVIFVNGRTRPLDWPLQPEDEVGIFPPIGGG